MVETTITLDEQEQRFLAEQVEAGHYGQTESDVLKAAIATLRDVEARAKALDAALEDGEASGPAAHFDGRAILADIHRKYGIA